MKITNLESKTYPSELNKTNNVDLTVALPTTIKYVDLFAGLGGFRIALEQTLKDLNLSGQCVFVSEIDKQVIKVYQTNFQSQDERFIDIRKIDPYKIPDHDFLFAGFPCQAFSNAGKKKGFLDKERGNLFFYLSKILKIKQPKYALLENVKHIVNHNYGKTWKTIIDELHKLGYLLPKNPLILNPLDYGIPQNRQRVFIPMVLKSKTNIKNKSYLEVDFTKFKDTFFKKNDWKDIRQRINEAYLEAKVDDKYYLSFDDYLVKVFTAWNEFVQNVRIDDNKTLPVIWLDWLRREISTTEMNSFPLWKQKYLREMRALYKTNANFIDRWEEKWNTKNWKKRERKLEWQAGNEIKDIHYTFIQLRQSGIRCRKPTCFPTLVAMVQVPLIFDQTRWRYLTPRETARLQCFPQDYQIYSDINSSIGADFYSYKQLGNSVNIELVKLIQKWLLTSY